MLPCDYISKWNYVEQSNKIYRIKNYKVYKCLTKVINTVQIQPYKTINESGLVGGWVEFVGFFVIKGGALAKITLRMRSAR